jgi:hypothetical protein
MTALAPLLAFPVAVWTVLVAISLVYWLFVMSGLVHLGEGVDGGAEGASEGTAGAIKGALEGAAGGHGPDIDGDVDLDGPEADVDAGEGGPAHGFLAAFRMRDVPITVSFSLVAFFSWALCLVANFAAHRAAYEPGMLVKCLLCFVAAPLFALPIASLVTRPLAPLLTTRKAKSSKDLIGKTCTIRTGEANATFGEALVKDTGADLVLRVRVEGDALKRGEEGLIVGWDEQRGEYIVESMDEAMGRRKRS